ncbi:hypothetical protein UF75_4854 [Desulfosporosinus sp. I2]|nr:hypothetical protein UF75_4854 [Desulfosporosinus sp. I2]
MKSEEINENEKAENGTEKNVIKLFSILDEWIKMSYTD